MNIKFVEKELEIKCKENPQHSKENQYTNKQPLKKKKNRTLQYYKFLLNSLKVEICLKEFYQLLKKSNQSEIFIWIISMILFYTGNREFPLVWLHILHFIRGIIGIFILAKIPRSYEVIEYINGNNKLMYKENFNDIIRDSVNEIIIPKLNSIRCILITYFSLTLFNFLIDLIDFLYVVSFLSVRSHKLQIVTLTFVILNFLYINLSYLLWTCSLKFVFSEDLINPFNEIFSGMIQKLKIRMKLVSEVDKNVNKDIKKEDVVIEKQEEKHSVIDLKYEKDNYVKRNKEYDSLQIDFDHNNHIQYINNHRQSMNRTCELKNGIGIKEL